VTRSLKGEASRWKKRRIDVRVLFEVEERVRVVMKFPSAKLDSVVGIRRCRDMLYGC